MNQHGKGGSYYATLKATQGVFNDKYFPQKEGTIKFKKVILALPKKAMKVLTASSPLLNADLNKNYPTFAKNLDGVLDMPTYPGFI